MKTLPLIVLLTPMRRITTLLSLDSLIFPFIARMPFAKCLDKD